mgnify:CR=1 FL=1
MRNYAWPCVEMRDAFGAHCEANKMCHPAGLVKALRGDASSEGPMSKDAVRCETPAIAIGCEDSDVHKMALRCIAKVLHQFGYRNALMRGFHRRCVEFCSRSQRMRWSFDASAQAYFQ